jgi:tetratricopeptide (TPR) repeat protein
VAPPRDRKEAAELLEEAESERTQMEWTKARALYERVARGRHRRGDGLLGLARVAWETSDADTAIAYAQKAIDAGAGEAAHMVLGHAYLKKGVYDRAIDEYERVLKTNPKSREAQKALREAQKRARGAKSASAR